MQGETTGTEGHLRDDMETSFSGNILKSIEVILMKSPTNEGDSPNRPSLFTKQGFHY